MVSDEACEGFWERASGDSNGKFVVLIDTLFLRFQDELGESTFECVFGRERVQDGIVCGWHDGRGACGR